MTSISDHRVSRRSFMKWSGVAGGSAALVATAAHVGMPGTAPAAAADGLEGVDTTVWNACTVNCGSRCPLRLQVKDGVIVRVLPDNTGDDTTFGDHNILACMRGRTMRQRVYSPDRLKRPMRRVQGAKRGEGEFEEISWETAFDEIAAAMKSTIDTYGNDALYINNGTGTTGGNILHRRLLWRFMDAAGGCLQPLRNYSNAAYIVASNYQFGTYASTNSTEDAARSNLLVMFGANLIETRMSGGGEMYSYQHLKKTNGTRIIVIDPRYSETAQNIADEWIAIRPGTDAALVAALVRVMIEENLQDQDFLDKYCVGFDENSLPEDAPRNSSYRAYVEGSGPDGIEKTPEWASEITGIPSDTIRSLAREIGGTKPCAISSGWGMQRQAAGENQTRAIFTLAAVTGNIGIPGGGTGGWPASYAMPVPNFPSLEKPITVGIPVFKWSDAVDHGTEMTAEKDGVEGADRLKNSIKFMINYAGQCIMNQHADPARITEILQDETKLETLVVIDTHMTPTAKMADYILPDAMSIEQPDLIKNEDSAETGYAIFAQPAIQPPGDAMRVYDMCVEILDRINPEFTEKFTEGKTQEEWVSTLYEQAREGMPELPTEEEFKEAGVIRHRNPNGFTIPLKEFRDDPAANPLMTPSGKIEIYSGTLATMAETWEFPEGLAGQKVTALPEHLDTWEGAIEARSNAEFPLQCINHHTKGRTHSTYWEQPWSKEAHPQKVWINPSDAENRGIALDDRIRVSSSRGKLDSIAFVTPRIAPGVISVPQGAWYTPNDEGIDEGACASTLASLVSSNIAKGNTQQTILAQVEKL